MSLVESGGSGSSDCSISRYGASPRGVLITLVADVVSLFQFYGSSIWSSKSPAHRFSLNDETVRFYSRRGSRVCL